MKQGIFNDIDINAYHADKIAISATGLKHAKKSLADFKYYLDGGYDHQQKLALDFGNAFELALLDREGFKNNVAILQTEYWTELALSNRELKRPKQSKTYIDLKETFLAENTGKYIIPDVGEKESFDAIAKMLESCYRDRVINSLIKNIQYQASLYWTDEKTGINMKTRPDICKINKNVVVNLKTALDASPEAFNRALANLDYPLQAICEIEGVLATKLMPKVDKYFWLVVEKLPPYNAVIYEFDQADILVMRDEYNFLLSRIKKAMDANFWPGYTDRADNEFGILTAKIPAYYGIYKN